jgi:hypothetical protein
MSRKRIQPVSLMDDEIAWKELRIKALARDALGRDESLDTLLELGNSTSLPTGTETLETLKRELKEWPAIQAEWMQRRERQVLSALRTFL